MAATGEHDGGPVFLPPMACQDALRRLDQLYGNAFGLRNRADVWVSFNMSRCIVVTVRRPPTPTPVCVRLGHKGQR